MSPSHALPRAPSVPGRHAKASPLSWNHAAFQNAFCSSGIGPAKRGRIQERCSGVCVREGEGSTQALHVSTAAQGLSPLSQVKLWKPQPLITAWHRAPSGFRVACIDSRSLPRTWVWAKFKHRHRQFHSFLWGGNFMVNHNYRYN